MEIAVLMLYADCLRTLNRKDEYIRVVMDIIAKRLELPNASFGLNNIFFLGFSKTSWPINKDSTDVKRLLEDVVSFSAQLPYEFTVSMRRYFSNVQFDDQITLFEDRDGFKIGVELCQLLADDLVVDGIRIRLVDSEDRRSKEIWLHSTSPCHISQSKTRVWLTSNVRSSESSRLWKVN